MATKQEITALINAIKNDDLSLDSLVESFSEIGDKWHNAGTTLKNKLPEKKTNKLQKKIKDRILYHHDMYKSAMSGGSNKKEAETHFVQMLKMKHLLSGLQGIDLKKKE